MKLKTKSIIKKLGALCTFIAVTTLSSCDSSDNDSNTSTISPPAEGMQRITLSGSADGTTAIDTNGTVELRIDQSIVTRMVVSDSGPIIVDVPEGSFYEARFIGPDNEPGFVGRVVCIYDDVEPVVVTEGERASIPGVPSYICPLQVDGSGNVQLIENPTVTQLTGQSGRTLILNVLDQYSSGSTRVAGFDDGSIIEVREDAIYTSVGTISISRNAEIEAEVLSAIPAELSEFTPAIFFGNNNEIFVFVFDSAISGYWSAADSNGSISAGSFNVARDDLSPK